LKRSITVWRILKCAGLLWIQTGIIVTNRTVIFSVGCDSRIQR
jgi:hypothetical protein